MTLEAYIKQEAPRRYVRVEVRPEECVSIWNVYGGRVAMLKMFDEFFQYFIPKGSTLMWTMDQDGNKKSTTVFNLKQ